MEKKLPSKITLVEVGPRDGFQFEKKVMPTALKKEIILGLIKAGLKNIQVTSFVHPRKVPQMADAEALMACLPKYEDVNYSALVLNTKGIERAHAAKVKTVEISISASDTHSRKNAGVSFEKALAQSRGMILRAKQYKMKIRAGLQCAFGCAYEGPIAPERVIKVFTEFLSLGCDMLAIADTTGMADPNAVKKLITQLLKLSGNVPIALHFHDTRGLGLVNLMAALECGISHFDTALAGMGGCPFVPKASGNISTEDTAFLLKSLEIETGIDILQVSACSKKVEQFFAKTFPGKLHQII